MSVCNIVRDLLPLYRDSALSRDSRLAVRTHLRTCPQCREYLKDMTRPRAPLPPPPPPAFDHYPALRERLIKERTMRRRATLGIAAVSLSLLAVNLIRIFSKQE